MKYIAIELLRKSGYLHSKRGGGFMNERVRKLTDFIKEHFTNEDEARLSVKILTNNSYEYCPKQRKAKAFSRLGGVSGSYQLWAVVRKV